MLSLDGEQGIWVVWVDVVLYGVPWPVPVLLSLGDDLSSVGLVSK